MTDHKPAQLIGAYYGPSIPPPTQSYHRPGRGRDCCCCGCLISTLLKIIVTLVIILGLAVLIFWLVVRPNKAKFHVTDASLTRFNLTTNGTLHYNLAVNITVRNPNKKIGIYYDRIEATAIYEDQRFDTVWLNPFYQGHKTTSYLNPVFDGQQLVVLGGKELNEYNLEKGSAVYSIDVKLYLRIRLKIGDVKIGKFKPKVECDLKVPLSGNGQSVPGFQTTKCDFDY